MAGFCESRCQLTDPVEPDEPRHATLPAPVGLIEISWCCVIEEVVIAAIVHGPRLGGPSGPWPYCGAHDNSTRFGPQLHFIREIGLVEEQLRNPDSAGVSNTHDP